MEMEQIENLEVDQGHAISSKEASSSRAQEFPKMLTRIEVNLRGQIDTELDPLVNEWMLWELRILHNANISYLKHGDATRDYITNQRYLCHYLNRR